MSIKKSFLSLPIISILIGITVLPLTACGQENPGTYAYAKKFFESHHLQLVGLVKLISDCKYAKQINSDPRANDPDIDTCSNRPPEYRAKIAKKLAKLSILWVTVDWVRPRPDGTYNYHKFTEVSFVLSSFGFVTGPGGGSAIWYVVTPVTDISGLKPLTPPPYHWLFKKFD